MTIPVIPAPQRARTRGLRCDVGMSRIVGDDAERCVVQQVLSDWEVRPDGCEIALLRSQDLAPQHYRLRVVAEGRIEIEASDEAGFRYAAHTLRALRGEHGIIVCEVEDGPRFRERGIFIESFWGTDLLQLPDWLLMLDRFAALKFNRLGISVYGCWDLRHDGDRGEYLFVPVPGFDKLRTPHRFRRYDAGQRRLVDHEYLPVMFAQDLFAEVVAYGARVGIEVIPFVAGPGHSSLLPREYPVLSARDERGVPVGYGYCVSAAEARAELERFFTAAVVDVFQAAGVQRFGVQADEFFPIRNVLPEDPARRLDPYCRCESCAPLSPGELLLRYLDLVGAVAAAHGLGMVHWHDSLEREGVLELYAAQCEATGRDVTVSWWGYNDPLPSARSCSAWRTWVTPTPGLIASLLPQDFTLNISQWVDQAERIDADGVFAYNTYQPAHARNYAAVADAAWNGKRSGGGRGFAQRWAQRTSNADDAALADDLAASVYGSYALMTYVVQQTLPYFAVSSGPEVRYTTDLLRTLATPFPALTSALRQARDTLACAQATMPPIPPYGPWERIDADWRWEIERTTRHLDAVGAAVELARAASRGELAEGAVGQWRTRSESLLDDILVRTPAWLAPIVSREHAQVVEELPELIERISAGEESGFDLPPPWHAWLF